MGPDWMGLGERHKSWSEKLQRGKDFSLSPQLLLKEVSHLRFALGLPLVFGGGQLENYEWVWEIIFLGNISDSQEP